MPRPPEAHYDFPRSRADLENRFGKLDTESAQQLRALNLPANCIANLFWLTIGGEEWRTQYRAARKLFSTREGQRCIAAIDRTALDLSTTVSPGLELVDPEAQTTTARISAYLKRLARTLRSQRITLPPHKASIDTARLRALVRAQSSFDKLLATLLKRPKLKIPIEIYHELCGLTAFNRTGIGFGVEIRKFSRPTDPRFELRGLDRLNPIPAVLQRSKRTRRKPTSKR